MHTLNILAVNPPTDPPNFLDVLNSIIDEVLRSAVGSTHPLYKVAREARQGKHTVDTALRAGVMCSRAVPIVSVFDVVHASARVQLHSLSVPQANHVHFFLTRCGCHALPLSFLFWDVVRHGGGVGC